MSNFGIMVGDLVDVVYNNNTAVRATVIYIAAGSGDMWTLQDTKETVFAQNPQSSNLDKIILVSRPSEEK